MGFLIVMVLPLKLDIRARHAALFIDRIGRFGEIKLKSVAVDLTPGKNDIVG
jgi:hypothetical protein